MFNQFKTFTSSRVQHTSSRAQRGISLRFLARLGIAGIFILCAACSKVDDYMLGKDNTPQPETLEPIETKTKLKEKWSLAAGSGQKNAAYLKLKPVAMGNSVYTADANGLVSAVNAKDGSLLWSQKLTEGVISGPSVNSSYVVVGTDASKVVVLEEKTGKELWRSSVSSDALAKPLIAKNKVIIKTIDGNLYAFDLASGKKLWLSEHGAPSLILKASSSPVLVDNKMLLVGYSDGKMDALDVETGQVLWQKSIAYGLGASDVERLVDIDADPIVQGDKVLLATYQGYLGALSLANGEFIWRKPASTYNNIIAKGDSLYMLDSDDVIWSVNKQTGAVNWKQVKLKARGLTEPSLLGDKLVFGDKTGMLHVISTQTGEFIARTELKGGIAIPPSVSGNNIYVMSTNGKLARFSVG